MNKPLNLITPCDPDAEQWCVIIETPKGSRNKYDYSPEFGCFQFAKTLPEGMIFPFDFGFLPSTLGDDGDPLDVLVLMDQPTFSGCLVLARLVGVIEAEQTERTGETQRNDRLVAVSIKTNGFGKVRSVKELENQLLTEIEHFFISYNEQAGKKFKLLGLRGPNRAQKLVLAGMKAFSKKHRSPRRRRNQKK